ncbi:type I restriction enzyme specificity HsdS domain protein [Mycoplasma haemofelis Ohio2]|uniref:Type I restriction enzyme specificity HsdS domain protein n=1 Tax=Mycoplasma haemofelis (strain Ohio2) TaxID=859194 RepID=F6FIL2_MYCHI|nr:type I restriction enzyme specificity HsdS domain protein [Mycoplasma haemofelis Ohio2]
MSFESLLREDKDLKYLELKDVCEMHLGTAFKNSFYRDSGFPIVKTSNIQGGLVITDNLKYCNPDNHLDSEVIKYGDIVMAKDGSCGKVGINLTSQEFFFDSHVVKFVPDEEILIGGYLYHCLLNFQSEIEGMAKGSTIRGIRKSELERLKIPVPSLETQTRIAETLDKFPELKQELLLRKRQHNYYRDQIWESLLGNLTH